MFKVIDRTLATLDITESEETRIRLIKLCQLLVKISVDYIELSVPVLKCMQSLPEDGHYILRINTKEEIQQYPGFEKYSITQLIDSNQVNILQEVEVKDLVTLSTLTDTLIKKRHKGTIRITGLDCLIIQEEQNVIEMTFKQLKEQVDFCPQDKSYCATAMALQWLQAGGRSVSVSFNGIGGYANLEEVLRGAKVIMNKKIKQQPELVPQMSKLYEQLTQKYLQYNKMTADKDIFNLETGVVAYEA